MSASTTSARSPSRHGTKERKCLDEGSVPTLHLGVTPACKRRRLVSNLVVDVLRASCFYVAVSCGIHGGIRRVNRMLGEIHPCQLSYASGTLEGYSDHSGSEHLKHYPKCPRFKRSPEEEGKLNARA